MQGSSSSVISRWLLIAAVVGGALLIGPGGITVSKAGGVALIAVLATLMAGVGAVRGARIRIPAGGPTIAVGVLIATMVVRVVVAEDPVRGLVGATSRGNGLVLYVAGAVLLLLAASHGDDTTRRQVIRASGVAAIVVSVVALDGQYFALGPWGHAAAGSSTLANPNFLGAWSMVVLPLAGALAMDKAEARHWRWIGAVASVGLLACAALSGSLQSAVVLAVVVSIVVLAWVAERGRRWFASIAAGLVGVGSIVAAITAMGAFGRGPAGFLGSQLSMQLRAEYVAAAVRMVADKPLMGVGPSSFAKGFRLYRSPEAASLVPLDIVADAAHSVPLSLAAEWGMVVALAWLGFVGAVTWIMVGQLQRQSGASRMRYAAVSAAWLGYVAQSLISIETPGLLSVGWVMAGLVVAPAVRRDWTVDLPWPPARGRHPKPSHPRLAATACVCVVMALCAWVVVLPWRADAAASSPSVRVSEGGVERRATTTAVELAPWEPEYRLRLLQGLLAQDELDLAQGVAVDLRQHHPDVFEAVLAGARMADANGAGANAEELYRRALELEPHHPDLAVEVAEFAIGTGNDSWARDLVAQALHVDPDHDRALELQDEL